MIRKEFLPVFLLLLLVFAGISYIKYVNRRDPANPDKGRDSSSPKESFWNYYNQASAYRLQGRPEKAAKAYQNALSLQPDHEDALYYAGIVDREIDSLNAARGCWEKLITINPQSERAFLQLGNLYLSPGNPVFFNSKRAATYYRKAIKLNRESPVPWLRLSEIALFQNDLKTASMLLGNLAIMDEKNPEISFLQGFIRWKEGTGDPLKHPEKLFAKIQKDTGRCNALKQGLFQPWLDQLQALPEDSTHSQTINRFREFDRYLVRLRYRLNE